jgi:hypothetical protein
MTNIGGNDDVHDTIGNLTIQIVCGPQSTRLAPPAPLTQSETSFQGDYRLSVFGEFASSNSLCPVVRHEIVESAEMFHLQDYGESFEISLLVHEDEQGYYPYTVQAFAEGGASYGFDAYMQLIFSQPSGVDLADSLSFRAQCAPSVIKAFEMPDNTVYYEIPREGAITRVFDTRSYISEPAEGCVQTFFIEFADGIYSRKVSIDEFNGYLFVDTSHDEFIDEEIIITVTTIVDNEPIVQRTPPLRIVSRCGGRSTVMTDPVLQTIAAPSAFDSSFTVGGSFGSSNPQCPVERYELAPQAQSAFTLEETVDGFTVQLRPAFTASPGVYPYTVIARGGGREMSRSSSSMEVLGQTQCERDVQDAVTQAYTVDIPESDGHWHTIFGPFDSCKAEVWAVVRDVCTADTVVTTIEGDET